MEDHHHVSADEINKSITSVNRSCWLLAPAAILCSEIFSAAARNRSPVAASGGFPLHHAGSFFIISISATPIAILAASLSLYACLVDSIDKATLLRRFALKMQQMSALSFISATVLLSAYAALIDAGAIMQFCRASPGALCAGSLVVGFLRWFWFGSAGLDRLGDMRNSIYAVALLCFVICLELLAACKLCLSGMHRGARVLLLFVVAQIMCTQVFFVWIARA